MLVRVTRKLAEAIDGVDLSGVHVGDVINLPARKARLLIAEEWATFESEAERRTSRGRKPRIERRGRPAYAMGERAAVSGSAEAPGVRSGTTEGRGGPTRARS
jgi:hypothetical protein